jgi:lipopolysaccharide transport system ATP-binding protein
MLLSSLVPFRTKPSREHWALKDVTFSIAKAETVGLLGRNGAGKTTLLRLLAGVTRPSEGRVTIAGRVAPLIGLGVGFHPEMTGRENIYVNGMLLGLTRSELDHRFDRIVEFAELGEYIDNPVKFYSSGMFMRLGFSVAAHVDPDILLIDEVLAVGDAAFQLKCFERLRHLQSEGATILLVSHSMHAIRLLCPRAILVANGQVVIDDSAEATIARHHELMSTTESGEPGAVSVVSRSLVGEGGPTHHPRQDDKVTFRSVVRFEREVDSPKFYFQVTAEDGALAYSMAPVWRRSDRVYRAGETALVEVEFQVRIGGGTYSLALVVMTDDGSGILYHDSPGLAMYVAPRPGAGGTADLHASIVVDGRVTSEHGDLTLGRPVARSHDGQPTAEEA